MRLPSASGVSCHWQDWTARWRMNTPPLRHRRRQLLDLRPECGVCAPVPDSSDQLHFFSGREFLQLLDHVAFVTAVVILDARTLRVLDQVTTPAAVLEIDRQVVPTGDDDGVDREVRHSEGRQTAVGRNDLGAFNTFFFGWFASLVR